MSETQRRIHELVHASDVVLFMKGVPQSPKCGFSAAVVQVLSKLGVQYTAVDVLSDYAIREGVKAYASWPTIPQLYVKGEFIGGCDIVREMAASGELQGLLALKSVATSAA